MIRSTGYMIWRSFALCAASFCWRQDCSSAFQAFQGQGFVLIALSFGILSHDFHWAKRANEYIHRKWHELRNRRSQAATTKETDHG